MLFQIEEGGIAQLVQLLNPAHPIDEHSVEGVDDGSPVHGE